jgi:hypothetical protein
VPGEVIDPFSVPPDSVASSEYRGRHRAVQGLLQLAGVDPQRDDGTIDPAAHARAMQLLQGDVVDRVPRNLARAIVREQRLDPSVEPALREAIVAIDGQSTALDDLVTAFGLSR